MRQRPHGLQGLDGAQLDGQIVRMLQLSDACALCLQHPDFGPGRMRLHGHPGDVQRALSCNMGRSA